MKVKPATYRDESGTEKPLVVIDHRTNRPIAVEGVEVPDHDLTFHRIVQDGDLIVFDDAPPQPTRPPRQPNPDTSSDLKG